MEDTFTEAQGNGCVVDDSSLHSADKDRELLGEKDLDCLESKSKRLARRVNSQNTLILKVKQLRPNRNYSKESFLRSIRVLDSWIPKHMVTVDEKYICRCLELIHVSASKASSRDISMDLEWEEMDVLSGGLGQANIGSDYECNFTKFYFDCSLSSGNGSVVISPPGHWIIGSIMDSKSMVNILNSPLFCKYGAYDGETNHEKASFTDIDKSISYAFMNSPGVLSSYSSSNVYREAEFAGKQTCTSETLHERLVSASSTTTSSDWSSSLLPASSNQGILHCTWKGGNPHFVFSVDDQKVVYVATLWKVESADDTAVDYRYLFYMSIDGRKEHKIHDSESHLVGKMNVSTSFSLGPNNSKTVVREFILFGSNEDFMRMQNSTHDLKRNKGLSKKVAEVFRNSQSIKKRAISRFSGSCAILESCPLELFKDTDNTLDAFCGSNLLENNLPPNIELVAIVAKDNVPEIRQENVGGWGLKFLQKPIIQQTTNQDDPSQSSGCARNTGDCSTSMEILVPAGLHGGPRTRNGGPSGLIERWRSSGCCDCGGWDLGCPLTILKSRSSSKDLPPVADMEECKLVDLIIEGSENSAPPLLMRMVNVYDGLYFVHFQSKLSALQSFSIAVAFIHTQSPDLQPKNVQELQ